MPSQLYGRESEQAAVETLLAAAAEQGRSGVLVLRGEPGIGKTALLDHAARTATGAGFRLVRTTGVQYEAELPFAGLSLLLAPALGRLPGLPAPQRRSLERAFGLAEESEAGSEAGSGGGSGAGGRPGDRLLTGLAVLSLLAELADEQPLLCLIDDAQWLDRESTEALLLAARRFQQEGVVLLLAARDGEGSWAAPGLPELRLRALAEPAAEALLAAVGTALTGPERRRILAEAHGNPLALTELPAVPGGAADAVPGNVPLAGRLQLAYHGQVTRLPAATQSLLLVAAAEETGDLDTVLRASALLGAGPDALGAAEDMGLVRLEQDGRPEGGRLVFRHPLLRSAVLQRAPLAQRLAAHRALAEVLGDHLGDERRQVWHLALAATGPDEHLAAALERTAERAARRGGHAGAAAAFERAARLSPVPGDAVRRHAHAAEAAAEGGELDRAAGLAEQALRRIAADPSLADELTQAQLLFVQGLTRFWHGDQQGAFDLLLRTADLITATAPQHTARVLLQAFHAAWYLGEEPVGRVRDRLLALAPTLDPEQWALPLVGYLTDVTGALLGTADADGRVPVPAPVAEVVVRAVAAGAAVPVDLGTVCGATLILGDDTGTARLAGELVAEARAVGAVGALPTLLFFLAEGELFTGLGADALTHAAESLRLAEDTGQRHWAGQMHSFLAYLAAVTGAEAATRDSAEAALAAGLAGRPWTQWALGLLDLGQGRAEECLSRLEPLVHGPQRHHVAALRAVPDLVEAAVRLRRPERVEPAFGYFRGWAGRSGQPWAAALVRRCEALLAVDGGAEEAFTAALKLHGEQHRPWDRARTELLYGEWLRRERRKSDARAPLRSALDAFEQLGAVPWAERARTELGATGTAAPQGRTPGALAQLTPQESQIVRLAAQGLSNRDIAAQLFLSSRTVGYHLYKAYPKLGVASRAELAGLL